MGESRLKMKLLYTSSPVKGHSVQCSLCLQCVSTRDMLQVWMHFRSPKLQQLPRCIKLIYSIVTQLYFVSDIHVILRRVTGCDEGDLKRPSTSDKNKGITDFHQWRGGSV